MLTKVFESRWWVIKDDNDFGDDSVVGLMTKNRLHNLNEEIDYTKQKKSKIIESILLGYPQIFQAVVKPEKDKSYIVVHGFNEMKAIADFASNKFELRSLPKLTQFNGFSFNDLPIAEQKRFCFTMLHITLLDSKLSNDELQDIHDRLLN